MKRRHDWKEPTNAPTMMRINRINADEDSDIAKAAASNTLARIS
jgi:hypothetical protein